MITVALIAGTVGCASTPLQYNLSVSSTEGGTVANPRVGNFIYNAGMVVSLSAAPDTGYHFLGWTGDVSTVGNVNASQTIIATNGNYSIAANFEKLNFMVAAGAFHTVGLKSSGRVVAAGSNGNGQCDVGGWILK